MIDDSDSLRPVAVVAISVAYVAMAVLFAVTVFNIVGGAVR